jgi:hypothetical protein
MPRGIDRTDGYLEALVKNMPSETVAGYLAVLGAMSAMSESPGVLLWIVWAVFLIATPLYMAFAKPKTETAPRPWWQVWIFAPIAFFVWSMTTGGPWAAVDDAAMWGSVFILLLTVAVFPLASMIIAKASS